MRKFVLSMLLSISLAPVAFAASAADVTAPIRHFIDAFNRGDEAAAMATYAKGDIQIIDEFAPHRWFGPNAPHDWAAEYDKHAQATGVTEGRVTYGAPSRSEIEGDVAYVVMPTTYLYKERGVATVEEGQVTAVVHEEAGVWKMSAWTWTGAKPHRAK